MAPGRPRAPRSVTSAGALQSCPWHPEDPRAWAVGSADLRQRHWLLHGGSPCALLEVLRVLEDFCASSRVCASAKQQPALLSHPELLGLGLVSSFQPLGVRTPWRGHLAKYRSIAAGGF